MSLPSELMAQIETFVGKYGYRGKADFVTDAVRLRLDYLQKREARMRRPKKI